MGPKDEDETVRERRDATPTAPGPRARSMRVAGPLRTGRRYEVGPVIASGGMGEVVEAVDEQIGRPVAIKRMIDAEPDPVDVDRFVREARIQGRLEHPAIAPVYELARDVDGRPFFAMKRLSGRTLDEVLDELPVHKLLRAFVDVCLAIEFAHEGGVIHRDLKPSNIMLGDFGEVYVIDWGIARLVGETETEAPGTRLGTPGYMSPEQIAGAPDLDGRADVYALGCILSQILAGRDVAPELDTLCVEATRLDRDRRLASARELGARVERYLDGDRDVAQRRELARDHLARANDALTAAGGDADRIATAMREAGRALVLDPSCNEAADLIRRMMAEPPSTTPAEVMREIGVADTVEQRQFARLSALGYLGYLFFVPVLLVLGLRDPLYLYAMLGVIALNGAVAWLGMRGWQSPWRTVLVVVIHGAMAALLTRMFSLVIVAPGAVAVTLMALIAHPTYARPRRAVAAVGFVIAAMLAPFLAELAGLLSRTIWIVDDAVVIRPVAVRQVPGLIETTFILWTTALVAIAAAMAWTNARRERINRHLLRVQAWRLRQLVPDQPATES